MRVAQPNASVILMSAEGNFKGLSVDLCLMLSPLKFPYAARMARNVVTSPMTEEE